MTISSWLDQLAKQAVARQDQSLSKLQQLATQGYTTVFWRASSAVDYICNDLDGQQWSIQDFLAAVQHQAPIFCQSHVNCTCLLVVSKDDNTLPEVIIDSY